MKYYQITVHTTTEAVEALSNAFLELGCPGVEIFDPKDILNQEKSPTSWDYIDEDLLKDLSKNEVLMRCYFSEEVLKSPADLEEMTLKIQHSLSVISRYLPVGSGKIDTAVVRDEDWMNAWKKYYRPFHAGRHLYIVPSWIQAEEGPEDIRIDMDPGMAFGTGTHETTSMCLEALEQYVKKGDTVYDIGCGSGILGICSAKLGAEKVICSDLDPTAVSVASENVSKNHVSDTVTTICADLTDCSAFSPHGADVIAANIIADVIISLTPKAAGFLKTDGIFIVSGIIQERRNDVLLALKNHGYQMVESKGKGSWCCLIARHR